MVRFVSFAALLAVTSAFAPSSPAFTAHNSKVVASSSSSSSLSVATMGNEVENEEPPLSPLTAWGTPIADIRELQQKVRSDGLPEFAPEVSAKDLGIAGDEAAQLKYFEENATQIKTMMEAHSAVIFRDFELMKQQDGFQQMYQAIGMNPCLDPLHSVSARPTVDGKKNSPVYEAVNKESRKNFFIGAFVCFLETLIYLLQSFCLGRAAAVLDSGSVFCWELSLWDYVIISGWACD